MHNLTWVYIGWNSEVGKLLYQSSKYGGAAFNSFFFFFYLGLNTVLVIRWSCRSVYSGLKPGSLVTWWGSNLLFKKDKFTKDKTLLGTLNEFKKLKNHFNQKKKNSRSTILAHFFILQILFHLITNYSKIYKTLLIDKFLKHLKPHSLHSISLKNFFQKYYPGWESMEEGYWTFIIEFFKFFSYTKFRYSN